MTGTEHAHTLASTATTGSEPYDNDVAKARSLLDAALAMDPGAGQDRALRIADLAGQVARAKTDGRLAAANERLAAELERTRQVEHDVYRTRR